MSVFFTYQKQSLTTILSCFVVLATAVLPLTLFTFASAALAQTSDDISLSQLTAIPARLGDEDFSLKAKPGQTIQAVVKVKNGSNKTQQISTVAEDFVIGEDGKQPIPVSESTSTRWSLAKWITIIPSTHSLKPGELATLDLLIQVPNDALPGGRYAMIMHRPSEEGTLAGSGTGISQRVGTLLYFVVEGEVNQEAYIRDVQVKDFFEYGPVPFSFVIDNRSDIHIHPNIQVEIKNMLGITSDVLTVSSQNVFPTTQRLFTETWSKRWGLGKYTATISANYGTAGKVALASFSFWLVPIRAILAMLFVLVLFLSTLGFFKKKVDTTIQERKKEKEILSEKIKHLRSPKLEQFKDEQN
ncbi:MAG: hypothetical protein ABI425_03535 [Patescibacteria group bacterium]